MDGVEPVGKSSASARGKPPAGNHGCLVAGSGAGSAACSGALTTRFGSVPLDQDRQIRFRGGLPGFPSVETFQLEPLPGLESELMLLQAVDTPEVGFITLPLPLTMPVLRSADVADVAQMLEIEPGELMILAIVTLVSGATGIETFLNLRAPLFVDVRRKVGAQVVLGDPSYPLRHRLAATA